MIIFLDENSLNKEASISLKKENEDGMAGYFRKDFSFSPNTKKLIFLSLITDGSCQKRISPGALAQRLIDKGLPSSVNEIVFIASDPDKSLFGYCMDLGKELLKFDKKVSIKATLNLENPTVTIPPKKEAGNWQIYALKEKSIPNHAHTAFFNEREKKLIFEGETLGEYLTDNDCTISQQDIIRSSNLSESSRNPSYR